MLDKFLVLSLSFSRLSLTTTSKLIKAKEISFCHILSQNSWSWPGHPDVFHQSFFNQSLFRLKQAKANDPIDVRILPCPLSKASLFLLNRFTMSPFKTKGASVVPIFLHKVKAKAKVRTKNHHPNQRGGHPLKPLHLAQYSPCLMPPPLHRQVSR